MVGYASQNGRRGANELLAIELAAEYGIAQWIAALLDDAAISQASEAPEKSISPPPKFKFTANDRTHLPPPNGTPARVSTPKSRGRPRAGSPAKNASPAKSTKKPRATKASKEADLATAREASAALQANLDDVTSTAASESVDGEKIKVEVESNVEVKGNTETTTTNVKIEMPSGSPELPLPERPEEMIAKAKEMVEEAKKIDGESSKSASKRKAEELDDDSDEVEGKELQPAKKARLLEQQIKKEKVRTRAMIGFAATLAIGYVYERTRLVFKNANASAVPLFRSCCRDRVLILIYCTCTSMAQEIASNSGIGSIAQVHYEDFFLSLSYPSVTGF